MLAKRGTTQQRNIAAQNVDILIESLYKELLLRKTRAIINAGILISKLNVYVAMVTKPCNISLGFVHQNFYIEQ